MKLQVFEYDLAVFLELLCILFDGVGTFGHDLVVRPLLWHCILK